MPENEAVNVGAHVHECSSCESDLRDAQSALSLLKSLPEIETSPEVWTRIEETLTETVPAKSARPASRPTGALRFWIRLSAAASILVAVLSFGYLLTRPAAAPAATVAFVAPDGNIPPGRTIRLGETFTAPAYLVLTLPDIGTLRVTKDTTLRFDEARRLTLESGEVFAEINPGGQGFQIVSGNTTATVKGTKFGVQFGTTVYVVEGAVEVSTPLARFELKASEVASTDGKIEGAKAEDYLEWLRLYERPTVYLSIQTHGRTFMQDSPLAWDLVLRTNSLGPLYMAFPRELLLLITGPDGREYSVRLDGGMVTKVDAPMASNGLMRLDVTHRGVISFKIDPRVFAAKGKHKIRAWVDTVQSEPVVVEVN